MIRVLVVDDDRSLLRALRLALGARGHEVVTAATGAEALDETALRQPDVVILDLGLPDVDGLEVCHRIRQWSDVPIIVLSATGLEERKVAALDGGADDYVTKPFGMAELEARIRSVLRPRRHSGSATASRLEVGELVVDLVHHEACRGGEPLKLTAKEFDILAFLVRHAAKVCTHQMILVNVWGSEYADDADYLRVYMYRLRRKLGDLDGKLLQNVPGVGYRLGAEP